MKGIDFFDVDHTITRRSTGACFIVKAIREGVLPLRLLFILPYYSFTYRLGFFKLKKYADGFPYLRGIPRETLERISRESFEKNLRGNLFPKVVSSIEEKKRAGRKVVLATSSLDFIVRPLAEHLGIQEVIATELEFSQGKCTGKIAGRPLFREEKRRRVLEACRGSGESAEACSFHSDSIYDLPLLEEVGEPVAVNPDRKLRRVAMERKWRIIDSP